MNQPDSRRTIDNTFMKYFCSATAIMKSLKKANVADLITSLTHNFFLVRAMRCALLPPMPISVQVRYRLMEMMLLWFPLANFSSLIHG